MQGFCGGETVDLDLFGGRKQVAALDHIEMTRGAGAVAAALVFHLDPVFERRIQYCIAGRGYYGKASRQKGQVYRRIFREKFVFHSLFYLTRQDGCMTQALRLLRAEHDPPKKKEAVRAFQILRFRAKDFVARGANPLILNGMAVGAGR